MVEACSKSKPMAAGVKQAAAERAAREARNRAKREEEECARQAAAQARREAEAQRRERVRAEASKARVRLPCSCPAPASRTRRLTRQPGATPQERSAAVEAELQADGVESARLGGAESGRARSGEICREIMMEGYKWGYHEALSREMRRISPPFDTLGALLAWMRANLGVTLELDAPAFDETLERPGFLVGSAQVHICFCC